jgi:hypothetical protein
MKRFVLFFAMIVTVAGLCGCGNNGSTSQTSTPVGSVSGKILSLTDNSPAAGITVQLLNTAFRPYTSASAMVRFGSYSAIDAANQKGAFTATTTTDINGAYTMPNIPIGKYAITPSSENPSQVFTPTPGTDLATVNVNGSASVVDFTVASPVSSFKPVPFTTTVTFKNLPASNSPGDSVFTIVRYYNYFSGAFVQYNSPATSRGKVVDVSVDNGTINNNKNILVNLANNTSPKITVTYLSAPGFVWIGNTNKFEIRLSYRDVNFNAVDISALVTQTSGVTSNSEWTYDYAIVTKNQDRIIIPSPMCVDSVNGVPTTISNVFSCR